MVWMKRLSGLGVSTLAVAAVVKASQTRARRQREAAAQNSPAATIHMKRLDPNLLLHSTEKTKKKQCVVLGAGVAGVTTAYEMGKLGYEVTILDKCEDISQECSKAPAGGMQKINPAVDAAMWMSAAKSLMPEIGSDNSSVSKKYEDFRFFRIGWWNALTDPHFLRWFLDFTFNSFFGSAARQEQIGRASCRERG